MPETAIARDRVDGWAKIANHLGCDVTTAIRWAKAGHLPVHQPSGRRGAVHAYRHELDAWLAGSYCSKGGANGNGNGDGQQQNQTEVGSSSSLSPLGATHPSSFQIKLNEELLNGSGSKSWRRRWGIPAAIVCGVTLAVLGFRIVEAKLAFSSPQLTNPQQLTTNGLEKIGLQTDGKQLFFGQYQNGWLALAAMPIDGGPIQVLWNPPMNVIPANISPDGKTLLALNDIHFGNDNEIWVVPLTGESPYRLGQLTAHSLAYAPDGKTIALASHQKIYLTNPDGSSPREIGAFTGVPDTLHWSADGKQLYFVQLDPVSRKPSWWRLVFADGTRDSSLRAAPSQQAPDSVSPWYSPAARDDAYFFADHGTWIAQYGRAWWEPAIHITRLSTEIFEGQGVAFDKASGHLFVMSGGYDHTGIEEFDPRTREFRYILPGITGDFPDYSRDKQWIAWTTRSDHSGAALWVARADGSMKKQLASFRDDLELPRWSPDGAQVAFMAKQPGDPYRIYVVRRDGSEMHEASKGSDNQGAPTWSPDARSLAYGNVECLEVHTCAIHTIDLTTRRVRTLPASEGMMTARWSPDGRFIAALRPEARQLLLFDLNQQRWRKLADSIDSADLGWSSNSEFLYIDLPGDGARIARISVTTGKEQTVLELKRLNTFDLTTVHDFVFGVAPDNDLLFSTPNPTTEIYSWRVQDR